MLEAPVEEAGEEEEGLAEKDEEGEEDEVTMGSMRQTNPSSTSSLAHSVIASVGR